MNADSHLSETAKPRPLMGLLKCLGWGVLVLAVLVVIGLLWHRGRVASKLREKLAELDNAEPGWRLEDIEAAREDVPDEENSAGAIAAAVQEMPRLWPPPGFPHELSQQLPPNEKLNDQDFVSLSKGLASVRPAVDSALKLADQPRGRHRIHFEGNPLSVPLPHLNESRKILSLLVCETMRRN
jgi:hypothetical protein